MSAELMQWLIYAAIAIGGYWLRHAGIMLPGLPASPQPATPSQPALPGLPPGIDLAQLLDLMRRLLETPPPPPKP